VLGRFRPTGDIRGAAMAFPEAAWIAAGLDDLIGTDWQTAPWRAMIIVAESPNKQLIA